MSAPTQLAWATQRRRHERRENALAAAETDARPLTLGKYALGARLHVARVAEHFYQLVRIGG